MLWIQMLWYFPSLCLLNPFSDCILNMQLCFFVDENTNHIFRMNTDRTISIESFSHYSFHLIQFNQQKFTQSIFACWDSIILTMIIFFCSYVYSFVFLFFFSYLFIFCFSLYIVFCFFYIAVYKLVFWFLFVIYHIPLNSNFLILC